MKSIKYELKNLFAWIFLHWALKLMPKESPNQGTLAKCLKEMIINEYIIDAINESKETD